MQTKKKLMIIELMEGLFGWAWILASVVSLYFLVMVFFLDGTWSNFFWAFGCSITSKWLAKAFQDSKARVAYETQLVSEGFTPEEAAQKWIEKYMGEK